MDLLVHCRNSFCAVVYFFAVVLSLLSTTMGDETLTKQVMTANADFTRDLFKELAKTEGNVFFSPLSIHALLSMAFQGARNSTAEKFASTLKIVQAEHAADGYSSIINRLNTIENVTLLMANKVYLMEGKTLNEDFKNVLEKKFMSSIEALNFAKSGEAADTINTWVREQTRDKIKELITANDLNALTRLVLLNAIYFKGDWLHKFNKDRTKEEDFFITKDNPVKVQMMHTKQKLNIKFSDELKSKIIELPYLNKDVSMFIILPDEIDGIKELEAKLAETPISEYTTKMNRFEVNVALPKFKIEQTIDLKDVLTTLGLGEIFDESAANFSGLMTEPTFVSKILQKSYIEVNEEGSEAAAVTGMLIAPRSQLAFFKANHPFIFLITETAENTKNILFAGRVSKLI